VVQHCEIENSVVLEYSRVGELSKRLADSLIGRNAEIARAGGHTQTLKLMIGDHSKVGI
jgi:NDP-sugar pyrophosphorylase family protein